MGKRTNYELFGWDSFGKGLSVPEKEALQDMISELGFDEFASNTDENQSYIMSFGNESFHAYDTIREALSEYAGQHTGYLLELQYECPDDEDRQHIRFHGTDTEEYDQISVFPPFTRLTHPGEYDELPILAFHFIAMEDMPEARILVLTERRLKEEEIGSLEDSISSYMDNVEAVNYEQAVRDVMNATDIGYWLLTPQTTFYI